MLTVVRYVRNFRIPVKLSIVDRISAQNFLPECLNRGFVKNWSIQRPPRNNPVKIT